MIYKSSKMFVLSLGIFFACLFGNSVPHVRDTDQLMQHKNPTWLTETIEPMSARDQLDSINTFKTEINAYRQQTNYILPLGPKSKKKLKRMSSWMYSNLIAESFSQSDLPRIIECAISLSECSFSNHYLFDALEYQLWSYNQEPPGLGDLGYTKLFYAMTQSQYFPRQKTFRAHISINSTCPEQQDIEENSSAFSLDVSSGFEFHAHLGKIVDRARRKIQNRNLGFYKKKESAQILTNIIVAYNMMSGEAFSNIKRQFDSTSFPLDIAITTLADLLDSCAEDDERGRLITAISNKKNLYRGLFLDFICKPETGSSASSCFDLTQEMPTDALRRQRKVILDLRIVINGNIKKSNGATSGFEQLIGVQLSKLGSGYTVQNNVYDQNLCSEIDFVVKNKKTGVVIRMETDGHYHFNQNFHGDKITSDLNGETRLKTSFFQQFGKVFRVSNGCDATTYSKRINSILKCVKALEVTESRVWFLPPSDEYASCIK